MFSPDEKIELHLLPGMREDVANVGGEVLWRGRINDEGVVFSIEVVARGNSEAVPAPLKLVDEWDVLIHNHPTAVLIPSDADLSVAAEAGNRGVGFYIVDNHLTALNVVVEPQKREEITPLDSGQLLSLLKSKELFLSSSNEYEERPSQIEMLKKVAESFNSSSISVVEAGTGVGKSFAYLIPAIKWVVNNRERVLISTGTINLQQQLTEKDIPTILSMSGDEVKVVLVKGRRNYLCLRRLSDTLREETLFDEEQQFLKEIGEWAKITKEGSLSDLATIPNENYWSLVNCEPDNCFNLRCLHYSNCFFMRARREASSAKILVANHHLLFADLSIRVDGMGYEDTAVLPPYQRVIVDEAHNIEACATSYFSDRFSRFSLKRPLNKIVAFSGRGKRKGLLFSLKMSVPEEIDEKEVIKRVESVDRAVQNLDKFSETLLSEPGTYRVTLKRETGTIENLLLLFDNLRGEIALLTALLKKAIDEVPEEERESGPLLDTAVQMRRLEKCREFCNSFLSLKEEESYAEKIYWIERERSRGETFYFRYIITPMEAAPILKEALFDPFPTIVCTSATLTIQNRFDYWLSRVGLLEEERVESAILPSPFNYKEQVLLSVPSDAPFPDNREYLSYLIEKIEWTLTLSGGNGLVLFTSYKTLKACYDQLFPKFTELGIPLYRQGEQERSRLLSLFKEETNSVLFATDSFWEGIDVPGEALKVVVIAKLPFRVPTDPIVEARLELIEKQGRNPFMELSLPDAVMRLKQGFGRLMRSKNDSGIVLILDSRIARKRYGSLFIDSLPPCQVECSRWEYVADAIGLAL